MILPPRWTALRPHRIQQAYWNSPHRFNVIPSGRRSGKTELAKRKLVRRALLGTSFRTPRFFAAAPTRDQAKKIYWSDLKAMIPRDLAGGRPSETELVIPLITGAEIHVLGMDKPERIEGQPWDGGILDEFANMHARAWGENVRPALSDRRGWCDLIGVPEGRNHYFDAYQMAADMMAELGDASEWGAFTWLSEDILPPEEIAAAKRDLDERTYRQEYCASFETSGGVVYYAFNRSQNVQACEYHDGDPLHVGIDFNVNPMSATVWQRRHAVDVQVDEIVLPVSDTDAMCDEIALRYGRKDGTGTVNVAHIAVYPDPAGWQRRTSAHGRTDIGILQSRGFQVRAMSSHPLVRDRINTVNARFRSADGTVRAIVSPRCRKSIACYEKLTYVDGSNEPDKSSGLDHIPDSAGYFLYALYGQRAAQLLTVNRGA